VGAVIFGILSDRYGRKWPLVWNLLLCCALELGSGFAQTFQQFLAVRSLFGIAMGGVWGLATANALENLPVEVRGFASGIIQEGYAVGYLIAAVINLFLVPKVHVGWRALFFTAAGISAFAAFIRALLPESELFVRAKAARAEAGDQPNKTKIFLHETKLMLKQHWKLFIYGVLLMTGFNFLSHGSQDLYPTYLMVTKGFSSHNSNVATIIGNCGAVAGGAMAGAISQYAGRRLTIILFLLVVGAFIPLWILPSTFGALSAGAFCLQLGVQGAWGIIPIFLSEMSPPAFRATFAGVAYQLGNAVSSASAQIEATGGDNLKILLHGKPTPDYATVQGIFIGVITAYTLVLTVFGPENLGARFEKHKTAFQVGGGQDDAEMDDTSSERSRSTDEVEKEKADIKPEVTEVV